MKSDPLKILGEEKPWYHNGLSFKCTECGKCCTGSPGYAWVSEQEIENIAGFLNITIREFGQRYLRYVDGKYSLRENKRGDGNYDCVFLKDKKCEIYPARPKQCRTFPWWSRNLKSKEEWEKAGEYCEGINHKEAPVVPFEVIQQNVDAS